MNCPLNENRSVYMVYQVNVHGDLTNADQYYRCDFCPKIFVNKTLRNNHLTTHTDERKYQVLNIAQIQPDNILWITFSSQCHLCALRFKTTGNLTAHLASCHDPEDTGLLKKFKCQFCPKTFRFPAQISQVCSKLQTLIIGQYLCSTSECTPRRNHSTARCAGRDSRLNAISRRIWRLTRVSRRDCSSVKFATTGN